MTLRKQLIAFTLLLCLAITPTLALATDVTPEQMLERLFTSEALEAEWFTPEFLAQVPLAQMSEFIGQYRAALGVFESSQGAAPQFLLTFERGYVATQIVLDGSGRISGLWLGPIEPKASGLEDALAGFQQLPGAVSVVVVSDLGVLAALQPEVPMAVGSTFKLAVLAALKDLVAAGALSWDDVVHLDASHMSLPSGILQDWPVGSPITLHTLASLMISISDNTATDALIDVVGRETVEAYTALNRPFLTTHEAFVLKNPANGEYLEAYRQGSVAERRVVLEQLKGLPLPDASIFSSPRALDIEWFFSAYELVNLMAYVQDLPMTSINPGLASPNTWQRIAYKGGSEPGVLNLTTWLVGPSGTNYYVVATWNNETALDDAHFFGLYSALLRQLAAIDSVE